MLSSEVMESIELMYETGWTDGLPVVPPTRDRVDQFLRWVDRPSDDLIAEVPPWGAGRPWSE